MTHRIFAAIALALAAGSSAQARTIDVPLRLDHELIRQALVDQLYTSPSGKADLWDDGTGCGFLRLREPEVKSAGTRVRIISRGEARAGTPIGDNCFAPVQWDGFIEIFEEPRVSDDGHELRFRVVESNLYDSQWKKRFMTGKIWDLVKDYVQPHFETLHIDLHAPLQDLRDFLPTVVARDDAERIAQILDSVHLTSAAPSDTGVTAILSFEIPAASPTVAAGPTPEPTLTPEELQRWEAAWQRWDAFLTFVVKQVGGNATATDLRQALGEVLIDARVNILAALAPPLPGAPDPTRRLFLKTWTQLAPVVRRAAAALPSTTALHYLGFIAAGDALAALDQGGPDIGLDVSADGLRRLARMVAPLSLEDPLEYSTAVDPQLRQVLDLGAPLPPPDLSGIPEGEAWWRGWRLVKPAIASEEVPALKTLERWLFGPDAVDTYLHAVHTVLDDVTKKTIEGHALEARYGELYRRLVLATAWQESCWRQFIRDGSKVTYIKSPVGSSGMMQVNEHVWRGLYDLRGLRWDIQYNGRAGAEILMHYLLRYAIARKEDAQTGGIENLARSTYAMYNGGPGQLTRYRKPKVKKSLKRIDTLFWDKYRAVSAGKELDVKTCLVGGN